MGVTVSNVRIFAIISYATFQAAFLYLAGYLSGLIEGHPAADSLGISIGIDITLLVLRIRCTSPVWSTDRRRCIVAA